MDRKLLLAPLTMFAISAVLGAGCGDNSDPQGSSTPTPATVELAATPTLEPVAKEVSGLIEIDEAKLIEIQTALHEGATTESFQFTLDANIQASVAGIALDMPVVAEGVFTPPGRSRTSLSIDMGFVSFETQTITADGVAYYTDPQTMEWMLSPDAGGLLTSPHMMVAVALEIARSMEVVGQEAIGDLPVLHLTVKNAPGLLSEYLENTATVDIWVSLEDMLLQRVRIEGNIALSDLGNQFHSQIGEGPASFVATVSLFNHGQSVVVETPIVETVLVDGRLPGTKVHEQINLVIDFGESHPAYKSVPATSGWHYGPPDAPATWGVHTAFIADEVLLQNLAQGGIGLHYNCPEGCPEVVVAFTGLADRYPKIVVSPYEGMAQKIAVTAWTYIDQMDALDLDRIQLFINAHHNSERAPEFFKP